MMTQPDNEADFNFDDIEIEAHLFSDFDQEDFDNWLRVGIEGYFLENRGAWAFGQRGAAFFTHHDYLEYGFRDLYDQLDAKGQSKFRKATANVLAVLPAKEKNLKAFECLLNTSALLGITEIINIIPTKISNGWFEITTSSSNLESDSLFGLTLTTLSELSAVSPPKKVSNCLIGMISSSHFHHAYSGVALLALCKSEPESFSEHMARLSKPIQAMFEDYDVTPEKKRHLATALLELIDLDNVVQSLPSLLGTNNGRKGSSSWVYEVLLEPIILKKVYIPALITVKTEGHQIVFQPTSNPLVEVFLENKEASNISSQLSKKDITPSKNMWDTLESISEEASEISKDAGSLLSSSCLYFTPSSCAGDAHP